MPKNTSPIQIPAEFIEPLVVNGLHGRRLHVPARFEKHQNTEIIFFYGHHASHERMYNMAKYLNRFGSVTSYDLPGFGGMDSFKKIALPIDIESYADYMCSILRAHKHKKRSIIMGTSLSFTMLTRTLQKFPDLTEKYAAVVSFVGFGDRNDLKLSSSKRRTGLFFSRLFATRLGTLVARIVVFNPLSLRLMLRIFQATKTKFMTDDETARKGIVQMELDLWRRNDLQTHFATYELMLNLRLPSTDKIQAKLYDVSTLNDQYFDAVSVRKSLKRLYEHVTITTSDLKVHVPSLIATEEEVAAIIPDQVTREVLKVVSDE